MTHAAMKDIETWSALRRDPQYIALHDRAITANATHYEHCLITDGLARLCDTQEFLLAMKDFDAARELNRIAHTEFHDFIVAYLTAARGATNG